MASPRTTLTPARRAIVDRFTHLPEVEQSALRALASGAGMDLWDYLERKGWGTGHMFSAAPAPARRGFGLPADMEASASRVLADRAEFNRDMASACDVESARLQRQRAAR